MVRLVIWDANYDVIVMQTFNDIPHADPFQSKRVVNTENTYKLHERYFFWKCQFFFALFLINEIQYNEYLVNARCRWTGPLAPGHQ